MYRYTFNPPDEELINYYLNNKITRKDYELEGESPINELNICHHEPEDITGLVKIESSHTWYFISPVEKFGRLNRTKRTSRTGHWKITGNSSTVKDVDGNPIGLKKFLVFQDSKRSSSSSSSSTTNQQHKTNWIIHEFHSFLHHPNKEAFVLCKLMKKTKTRRSGAVAVASPAAIDLSITSDPIINHSQPQMLMENDTNIIEDYCNDLEELIPEIHTTNWPQSGSQLEPLHWSWEGSESSGLQLRENGYMYEHNSMDDAYSGSWTSEVVGPIAFNDINNDQI